MTIEAVSRKDSRSNSKPLESSRPERQIALVTTFADQAVIAIENVRLFNEVQMRTDELTKSVEELRSLGEVSQAVNSTLDLEMGHFPGSSANC
jgi:GAF domain-containing protein